MFVASSHPARRRAFTLIELLVVIAIIAILAAILFPVFAQAREAARKTSCLSNTKQLDLGVMMYVQDYDETFPYWNWSLSADAGICSPAGVGACGNFSSFWINAIYPYVKNAQVYACPDDNLKEYPAEVSNGTTFNGWSHEAPSQWGGVDPALWNAIISYGMTETFHFGEINGSWGAASHPVTLASLQQPAGTMILGDTIAMSGGTIYDGNGVWGNLPNASDPTDPSHYCTIKRVAYANQTGSAPFSIYGNYDPCSYAPTAWDVYTRHQGGANIAFGDGHAKSLRAAQVTNDLYMGTQAQ